MITSFGYNHSDPPPSDHVFDVRDLTHNTSSPAFKSKQEEIMKAAKEGGNVAIGCKQGKHRSVELANQVSWALRCSVYHRDSSR